MFVKQVPIKLFWLEIETFASLVDKDITQILHYKWKETIRFVGICTTILANHEWDVLFLLSTVPPNTTYKGVIACAVLRQRKKTQLLVRDTEF